MYNSPLILALLAATSVACGSLGGGGGGGPRNVPTGCADTSRECAQVPLFRAVYEAVPVSPTTTVNRCRCIGTIDPTTPGQSLLGDADTVFVAERLRWAASESAPTSVDAFRRLEFHHKIAILTTTPWPAFLARTVGMPLSLAALQTAIYAAGLE